MRIVLNRLIDSRRWSVASLASSGLSMSNVSVSCVVTNFFLFVFFMQLVISLIPAGDRLYVLSKCKVVNLFKCSELR